MNFIFGSQNVEKTTCLIHLANEFILNNKIKQNNGYILLFTPPHLKNTEKNTKAKNEKEIDYNFVQYFTCYSPEYAENLDLIKCYILTNLEKSCNLLNNFIQISQKNKGLKLILIDDLTNIIHPWVKYYVEEKIKGIPRDQLKKEKEKIENMIYNQVFQYFLRQISLLQKSYQAQCLITIKLDPTDRIYYTKYEQKIFNAIFPFVRNTFFFQKLDENQIDLEEVTLILNRKVNKIELSKETKKLDLADQLLKEMLEDKNIKYKKNELSDNSWIKKSLGDFIESFNEFSKNQAETMKKYQEEEDSTLTQIDK